MMIREPAVADRFYPHEAKQCEAQLRQCLDRAARHAGENDAVANCQKIVGGIVPHAGWVCSGAVAGRVFREMSQHGTPSAIVIFGAIHVRHGPRASVFPSGAWETPLGLATVDGRLAERLQGQTGLLEANPHAHEREHSIEVEVPFLRHLMPDALIVPVMVPVNEKAAVLGAAIGRTCKTYGVDAVFVGSTDLTHYGPSYAFTPRGVGPAGLTWAKDVNDRRMIDLILAMGKDDAVEEAVTSRSACGGGAIAATLAACIAYGAKRATLLEHTTSYEVLSELQDKPMYDAVGYAGIVFD